MWYGMSLSSNLLQWHFCDLFADEHGVVGSSRYDLQMDQGGFEVLVSLVAGARRRVDY